MTNANTEVEKYYHGGDGFYKHAFGMHYSMGVSVLCQTYQCFWFLDVVVSYQPQLKAEEFQVWKLIRKDGSDEADVICDNGNGKVLIKQHIPFTDFKPNEATIWVEFGTALLPSEH